MYLARATLLVHSTAISALYTTFLRHNGERPNGAQSALYTTFLRHNGERPMALNQRFPRVHTNCITEGLCRTRIEATKLSMELSPCLPFFFVPIHSGCGCIIAGGTGECLCCSFKIHSTARRRHKTHVPVTWAGEISGGHVMR